MIIEPIKPERPFSWMEWYDPDPNLLYSIEAVSHLARVPRRWIALYCRQGLVSPVMDPDSGGWYYNDEGVRTLRRIKYLRASGDMNLAAIQMILGLTAELERLREEVHRFRQQ